MLQHFTINRFLKALEQIKYGSFHLTTPEGKSYHFTGEHEGINANATIDDWRVITAFAAKGDIGLAESYRDGWWDTGNLVNLLLLGLKNEHVFEPYIYGNPLSHLAARLLYLLNRNTLQGSKRNISAHYDLGNDFYQLWLDPSMTYSSALFQNENETLEQAQHNKYDRMLERLDANSGNLLEIGCGWGGFAERAANKNDYHIKGITLSHQQHAYATARLGDKAAVALEDYRHQEGQYNRIVSIEMFEAVGEKFWPVYFSKMKSLLANKGKAMVQTITMDEPYFERYRKSGDMIRSFIFPGGMLPTSSRFAHEAEKQGLRVTDSHAFGKDYATTLQHWLDNFESSLPQVKGLGFDESFIRIWRFYLCTCIASFTTGRTNVMQLELQHA